jgi:hypothetical protein
MYIMAETRDVKFPGAEKHEITLKEAIEHVTRHRKNPVAYKVHGAAFERAAFDKILAQPDCKHVRIYFGQNEDGSPSLVFLGVNSKGEDMVNGVLMEKGAFCPPFCDAVSILQK